MPVFVAIDPGITGAVAILRGGEAAVYDTPTTATNGTGKREYLAASMRDLLALVPAHEAHVVIEEPQVYTGRKVKDGGEKSGASAGSALKQGRGVGLWEGIVVGLGLSYEFVHPNTWARQMNVTREKGARRVAAARLFPALAQQLARVKDDGRADALLIAEWARRRG